ncbi:hypothetical protein GOODEAATRI_027558 [Goodea atripinnis]|uniref:Uncharacterized protein n=1 Tax=Goodea atripinnis TaxID=208336 RepID=A0ABV0ML78_9TELE
MGERRGTPWTGRQSIAGQHTNNHAHTHSHTSKGNLERPINLTVTFLDCGRKPEYLERTHACTGRTGKLLPNPGPSCCKATVLPTAPPCSLYPKCFKVKWVFFVIMYINSVFIKDYDKDELLQICLVSIWAP